MKSDQDLQADVLAALTADTRVKGNEVGVIAKDGAITLTGKLASYAERLAAEQVSKRVAGVRAIAEEIAVKSPAEQRVTDEGIAERIAPLSSSISSLRNADVLAEVRSGFVTLTGEVDFLHQSQLIENRVAGLEGVVGISNRVTIREREPELKASNVVQQIMHALHRHPDVDASNIRVSIAGDTVKLEGAIHTDRERELVEEAVWTIRGVAEIENHLRVG
jgi:osmotically-inducible protein OsmY